MKHRNAQKRNRVTAIFQDARFSFEIGRDVTLAQLAEQGELYFNLHTTGQTYFGDIRGQIHPAGK